MKNIRTLFIVDDNRFNLMLISRQLKKKVKNCEVKTFESAHECLRQAEIETPDLILSDYHLNERYNKSFNGNFLVNKVKKMHPNVPVIMYSSLTSLDLAVKMMKEGVSDFVPRDEHFLERIVIAASKNLKAFNERAKSRAIIRNISLSIIGLIAVMLFLNYLQPSALPFFMALVLVALFVAVFFNKQIGRIF